jgi:hypothetical protein
MLTCGARQAVWQQDVLDLRTMCRSSVQCAQRAVRCAGFLYDVEGALEGPRLREEDDAISGALENVASHSQTLANVG